MLNWRRLSLLAAISSTIYLVACSSGTPPAAENSQPTNQPAAMATHGGSSGHGKININTAILSELDKLEAKLGVPALSHKIQSNRPYVNPEELVSKKVVSQEQYDQIKDLVTIEDIVLTGEAKDIDYMIKLGLMKGHMMVAKELLDLGKPDQAEPHIGHPVEEIYVDIEEQLAERGVPDFKEGLLRLQDLVKGKPNDPAVATEFAASMAAIDKAIAALPESQRQSPSFVLQVINGLLDTATAEYTAAISNGKIAAAIEYQDSRGFVLYAQDTLYPMIGDKMTGENAAASAKIKSTLADLATAWPAPLPPETLVMTAEEVAAKVKQIGQNSQGAIAVK